MEEKTKMSEKQGGLNEISSDEILKELKKRGLSKIIAIMPKPGIAYGVPVEIEKQENKHEMGLITQAEMIVKIKECIEKDTEYGLYYIKDEIEISHNLSL